ncbi:MAG: fumarylacetoacetate hydrolase [Phycisphaeraceae bacterium]|nr:fumarylacetoacetate hydrolase [Phycisphaeraceae bacterium]
MNRAPRDCTLPTGDPGILVGRCWCPARRRGVPVRVIGDRLVELPDRTITHILREPDPAAHVVAELGEPITLAVLPDALESIGDRAKPHLLSPVDLQPIKAAGVTFVESMLERVIEEATHGDASLAAGARTRILETIGGDVADLRPGSPEALRFREAMIAAGRWSPYLEVGLGPDAEIFTKASPMSAVGTRMPVGIRSDSAWNNPEPEVVLACAPDGRVVGATLGNDVNLRDWEGRSALLLGRAKDNRGSAAIGPFIRLFDRHLGGDFDLDVVRRETVTLDVEGADDRFTLHDDCSMEKISRDPEDLAAQLFDGHDWPDGVVLYLGTMFAPTRDRPRADGTTVPGDGFTHHVGDRVRISSPHLGSLENVVLAVEDCPRWVEGLAGLLGDDRGA